MNGTRTAILAGLVAALLLAPASAGARGPLHLTCNPARGHVVFQRGHTRLFWMPRGPAGAKHAVWYACSSRIHRPRPFVSGSRDSYDLVDHFRGFGNRVGFVWKHFAAVSYGMDIQESVGWVDVTTGEERDTVLTATDPSGLGLGDVTGEAVGTDGAVAGIVKPQGDSELIAYAPNLADGLGDARPVSTVDAGDVIPASLQVSGDTVSWTSRSGGPGTAPVLP
jgi:hypothetical protein